MGVDSVIEKAKGGSGSSDSSPEPKQKGSSGPVSRDGLSKGVDTSELEVDEFFEAKDGELNAPVEEELGYGIPLLILDERGKGCGKSSCPSHPDIPRPVGDQKTTYITCSPETKKGIIDRYGEVPEYVNILNVGKNWQAADPSTAKEGAAVLEKFLKGIIQSGGKGLCNVVVDDGERFHEKFFIDVCRAEFGYDAGEFPFDENTQDFYLRRKVLDDLLLDLAIGATEHLLFVNGYAGEWTTEEKEIAGERRAVRSYEPKRWVDYFEKPFDVVLVGDMHSADDEGAEVEEDTWTIRVRSSKVNRLFPQGARYDTTGPGVAKFWQEFEAKQSEDVPDGVTDDDTDDAQED